MITSVFTDDVGNRIASSLYFLYCKHRSCGVSVHKSSYTRSYTSTAAMCRIALRNKATCEFALIRAKQGLRDSVFILGYTAPCEVRL